MTEPTTPEEFGITLKKAGNFVRFEIRNNIDISYQIVYLTPKQADKLTKDIQTLLRNG